MAIRFDENDVRPMGRTAAGVRAIRLKDGDEVVAAVRATDEDAAGLPVTENGYGKRTRIGEYSVQNRGGQGLKTYQITQKTGEIVGAKKVTGEEDILLVSDDGTIIRMPVSDISVIGRVSQGVRVMRVEEGSRIVCVTATERDEDEQAESEDGQTEADSLDMDVGGENSETQPEETDE